MSRFDPAAADGVIRIAGGDEDEQRRIGHQLAAVRRFFDSEIAAGNLRWWTLAKLADAVSYPEPSISARLRDLRALGYKVDRRAVPFGHGLREYRVTIPSEGLNPSRRESKTERLERELSELRAQVQQLQAEMQRLRRPAGQQSLFGEVGHAR